MLLVDQNISISCLAIFHINNSLVGILHWNIVVPGLNTLFGEESQHILDLVWGTNERGGNRKFLEDEGEHCFMLMFVSKTMDESYLTVESRNGIIRCSNLNKSTLKPEEGEIALEWEFW